MQHGRAAPTFSSLPIRHVPVPGAGGAGVAGGCEPSSEARLGAEVCVVDTALKISALPRLLVMMITVFLNDTVRPWRTTRRASEGEGGREAVRAGHATWSAGV